MSLFKVTLTKTMMLHEETVQGDHCDVKRWAHKEAKAYGVSLHNITIERISMDSMPNTRQARKDVKIIRPIQGE